MVQDNRQLQSKEQRYATYEEQKRVGMDGASGRACSGAVAVSSPRHVAQGLVSDPIKKRLFSEVPSIEGSRVVLDRVVDGDAAALRDLIDDQLVQRYLPTYLFEKQREDVHETISLLYGDLFANKESIILAIRGKGTGEMAGLVELYGFRDSLHKISVGYRLRRRWWGHGLATETAKLMVGYLYGATDIEIITASTMVENAASAHVLAKAGFIRTARAVKEDWGFLEPTIVDKWFC